MTSRYHASCLCQQVTFSVAGFEPLVAHCHCTMCRQWYRAYFLLGMRVEYWFSQQGGCPGADGSRAGLV